MGSRAAAHESGSSPNWLTIGAQPCISTLHVDALSPRMSQCS